ncbi:MAG: hypothetical protein K9H64_22030 [Bacteroidales bacterium]|nr:hypothetical protein [Bacteroidales bacterium]MCF8458705.1 hypothetical protein [Bacteroidales bacterium]
MKRTTILATLVVFFAMNLNATVWTVSNHTGMADYTSLQTAIDSAGYGDTLYLEASPNSYGNATFYKKLIVVGPGYWLIENDSTQANMDTACVNSLIFNPGSEGSILSGITVNANFSGFMNSNIFAKMIIINTDSITIQRCHIVTHTYQSAGKSCNIYIDGNRNNIVLQQNWINTSIENPSGFNGTAYAIYFTSIPENTLIINNFIRSYKISGYQSIGSIFMNTINSTTNLIISNNVIWGNLQTYYAGHINNVLVDGNFTGNFNVTMHNLCSSTQYPVDINNQQNINMDSVFVDVDSYIDNGYLLKPNSPAIGAGLNGVDCGAFGESSGGIVYKLSGLPDIPAIFEATIDLSGTTQIPVNIKAKSHN